MKLSKKQAIGIYVGLTIIAYIIMYFVHDYQCDCGNFFQWNPENCTIR